MTTSVPHLRVAPGESAVRKHAVWVLVSLAYLAVAPYFPRINNPNENVRIWMTHAIVEHHTLTLDSTCAEWGYVDDKAASDRHIYSSKAPGTSFLGVPVLWLQTRLWHGLGWPSPSKRATTFGLRFFSVVPCALLFLFVFARWVERRTRSPAARDLLLVGLGLGTLIYPYGVLFVGHAQAALAAFGAFMALTWRPDPDAEADAATARKRLLTAGALAGASVLFEYQLLLVGLVLAGFAVWRFRARAAWFVVGAAPLAILLGGYHTTLFGRPWAFPYGHLENQTYANVHHAHGFFGLGAPRLDALGASLFSVSYGLFAFSPFLLLGLILALRRLRRAPRAEAVVILLAATALVVFLAGMTHWRAGWCVGPRYIAGLAPFLAAGFLCDDDFFGGEGRAPLILRAVLGGLIAVSVFSNGLSAATYPHYPEQYDNPLFDLTLPLWRDGYVPAGLGHALGLARGWALAPVVALWVAALGLALAAGTRRPREMARNIGAAALIATLMVAAMSRYGRVPSSAEQHATSVVRGLWDPPRRP
jgi:hypothetical protein